MITRTGTSKMTDPRSKGKKTYGSGMNKPPSGKGSNMGNTSATPTGAGGGMGSAKETPTRK